MSEPPSNLFVYLGKPVKDEYGHVIGTMASFQVTPGGRINGVFIDHGDGRIKQYSRDQIKTENDGIILFSTLKMKANNFCNQIPLLWRKTQAIKDLNNQNKIPDDMYSDLYSSFEGALNQLKAEAENTIAEVEKEAEKCALNVKELNSALINLEIEREIGQVDEESYQRAVEMVKEGLKRFNAEKKDFETLRSKLSNMSLGEPQREEVEEESGELESQEVEEESGELESQEVEQETQTIPVAEPLDTSLPEPPESSGENPVVVYVKNVDDQGS